MTAPRLPALWLDTSIAGFAARIGQLDIDNEDDIDMLMAALPLESFTPADGPGIWRLSTPAEIVSHARKVFELWQLNDDDVYVLAAPSIAVLGEVLQVTGALLEQVIAAGEIAVVMTPTGGLDFGFRTIRARVVAESMAALTGRQRFVACARCGGWFPIERVGALYCSRRCQSAHQRLSKDAL